MNSGIETVITVLEAGGFERLPDPLVVADSAFDFDAAVKGTGVSNDLVVVAMSSSAPQRLVRLLNGLSRMLDQVDSRRPVTMVLLGGRPDASLTAELERHARVLTIESRDPNLDEARNAVAVLMPLTLPSATSRGTDPLLAVAEFLGPSLSDEHRALIEAAKVGPDGVRDSLRRYIDGAVQNRDEGRTS